MPYAEVSWKPEYRSRPSSSRSPKPTDVVAQYFQMNSPTSVDKAPSQREIGTQTDLTLSIRADRVTWMPKVEEVTEEEIEGMDAKLEFAIKVQPRDVIPERCQSEGRECSESDTSGKPMRSDSASNSNDESEGITVAQRVDQRERQSAPQPTQAAEPTDELRKKRRSVTRTTSKRRSQGDIEKIITEEGEEQRKAMKKLEPLLALSKEENVARGKPLQGKMKLRRGTTMDTGTHHNVMPKKMIGNRKIRASAGSRKGMSYVAAGGEKIPNEGEVDFGFELQEGHRVSLVFQIAEGNKPLGSVTYVVDKGFRVVYDKNMRTGEDMSYTTHKAIGKTFRFRSGRNVWIL